MKIALVLDDSLDVPDGVQQYVLTLGNWLTKIGHEVHYLVGQTKRTDIPHVHSLSRNISVKFNGNRMRMPLPANNRKLQALLAAEQYDVLHVQMPYSPFMAAKLIKAAPAKTKIIGTFHIVGNSRIVSVANRLLAVWLRSSLQKFDTILAASTAAAEFCKMTFRLESIVVPNMVDISTFAVAKQHRPIPHIVFLGRLVPRKGCRLLLEALTVLNRDYDNVQPYSVTIAGKGELLPELQVYVRNNDLSDYVQFSGFVSEADKPKLLASADISVFPSNGGESFGIILVEAMASGASVVLAGDNVGYRTVLHDEPSSLFDPFDATALAQKLYEYLQNAQLRTEAAMRMKELAQKFDVTVVGPVVVRAYQNKLPAIVQ